VGVGDWNHGDAVDVGGGHREAVGDAGAQPVADQEHQRLLLVGLHGDVGAEPGVGEGKVGLELTGLAVAALADCDQRERSELVEPPAGSAK
jgi:hypothetical protein